MTTKNGKTVDLQVITMIDPTTGYIRMVHLVRADVVSNIVELA